MKLLLTRALWYLKVFPNNHQKSNQNQAKQQHSCPSQSDLESMEASIKKEKQPFERVNDQSGCIIIRYLWTHHYFISMDASENKKRFSFSV